MRHLLPITLAALAFHALTACKTRSFHTEGTQAPAGIRSEPAPTPPVAKAYGGPFNFGIKFNPVDANIATRFWQSWKDERAFATRALNGLRLTKEVPLGETGIAYDFSSPELMLHIAKAMRLYFATAGKWAQLNCQQVDMEAAYRGEFKVARKILMNRGEPHCHARPMKEGQTLSDKAGWRPDQRWKISDDRKPTGFNEAWSENRKGPTFAVAALADSDGKTPRGFVVQVAPDFVDGAVRAAAITPMSFYIVGNFVFPVSNWATSKAFAAPVMELDGDAGSATFLQPTAWYDMGLLVLNALPEEGNTLISRVGENLAKAWSDPSRRASIGMLGHKFPIDRMNTFVTPGEAAGKDYFSDENMERMPIGSVHFIANAFWAQMGRGLTHFAYVTDLSRKELIDLYLAPDKGTGAVWINVLDRSDFGGKSPSAQAMRDAVVGGQCEGLKANTGVTSGMFLETEIILGFEKGRSYFSSPKTGVSKCVIDDPRD